MQEIETVALSRLPLSPRIYMRYIDDIIMLFEIILSTFNSVIPDIKFTIETPEPNEWLPFLDMQLRLINNEVHFSWYRKGIHSGNILRKDSHMPSHVKANMIKNGIKIIKNRSSSTQAFMKKRKNISNC